MPPSVLDRYWKEPHFRPFELEFFSGVLAPLRTFMLMWVIAFPCFGKRRALTCGHLLVPAWYRTLSAILTVWFLAAAFVVVAILTGFSIYEYLAPQWKVMVFDIPESHRCCTVHPASCLRQQQRRHHGPGNLKEPQVTGLHVFLLLMGTMFSVFFLIPSVVIMQFLMPRAVLDRY